MTTPQTKNTEEKFPVTHMAFHKSFKYLVLGDDFGSVTIWDLSILLKKIDSFKEDPKVNKKGTLRKDDFEDN